MKLQEINTTLRKDGSCFTVYLAWKLEIDRHAIAVAYISRHTEVDCGCIIHEVGPTVVSVRVITSCDRSDLMTLSSCHDTITNRLYWTNVANSLLITSLKSTRSSVTDLWDDTFSTNKWVTWPCDLHRLTLKFYVSLITRSTRPLVFSVLYDQRCVSYDDFNLWVFHARDLSVRSKQWRLRDLVRGAIVSIVSIISFGGVRRKWQIVRNKRNMQYNYDKLYSQIRQLTDKKHTNSRPTQRQ